MKKYCLFILIVVLVGINVCTLASAESICGLYTYEVKDDGTARILYYNWEENNQKDVTIPSELDGHVVTEIGEYAFTEKAYIEEALATYDSVYTIFGEEVSVILPDTCTEIGNMAFMGTQIKSIGITKNITLIGYGAFNCCDNLSMINVDNKNENYASIDGILYEKKTKSLICCPHLTSSDVEIPEGIVSIGDYAFFGLAGGWVNSYDIKLPDTLESIGNYAFAHTGSCSIISSTTNTSKSVIDLPKSVNSIGEGAFCRSFLPNFGDYETIDLSNTGIKDIPAYAFYSVRANDVFYPKGLETIGDYAFYSSGGMTPNGDFPNTVKNVGAHAFENVVYIDFDLTDSSQLETVGESAFKGCSFHQYKIKDGELHLVLPNTITSIGANAFYDIYDLVSIELPTSLTEIGEDFIDPGKVSVYVEEGSFAAEWCASHGIINSGGSDTSWLNG